MMHIQTVWTQLSTFASLATGYSHGLLHDAFFEPHKDKKYILIVPQISVQNVKLYLV